MEVDAFSLAAVKADVRRLVENIGVAGESVE